MKKLILSSLLIVLISSCNTQAQEPSKTTNSKVQKTESEWKLQLTAKEFNILRNKGTEAANSGIYNDYSEKGVYTCKGCNAPLFKSENKFNSHSGWPSFDTAIKGQVTAISDISYGMTRTEVICATCDGHLGHVFNDGPKQTTGKRFCVNSASLNFENK